MEQKGFQKSPNPTSKHLIISKPKLVFNYILHKFMGFELHYI